MSVDIVINHNPECGTSEAVLDLLPVPQPGAFSKEDGERVVDERSATNAKE